MQGFLLTLLTCSVTMSVLAFLYMAITPLLARRYSVKGRYYAWLVVVIGLIIPFRPHFDHAVVKINVPNEMMIPMPLLQTDNAVSFTIPAPLENTAVPAVAPNFSRWLLVGIIWVVGMTGFLAYHAIKHCRFVKMIKRWRDRITDKQSLFILQSLQTEMGISKPVDLCRCSCIDSPLLIGLVKPCILLPHMNFNTGEIRFILKHELVHLKRKDLYYKILVLMAAALHWFNPGIHFMAKAIDALCEMSCDAETVQDTDADTRLHYSEMIIGVAQYHAKWKTALSTHFYGGKKGMKKRIFAIMDTSKKKTGMMMIGIALIITLGTGFALAAKISAQSAPTVTKDTAFTEAEYHKILALRLDGYEDMSVAEYREKVWAMIDTPEYLELLERFSKDAQQNSAKDVSEIASFFFSTLAPLTSEQWQSRDFSGYATTNDADVADNARLEYWFTLAILNPNALTVREYNEVQEVITGSLQSILLNKTEDELQNTTNMQTAITDEITQLQGLSSNRLKITIDYSFLPLSPIAGSAALPQNAMEQSRKASSATEEDYRSLLTLKTENYQNMSVADFNAALLEWGNKNDARYERISVAMAQKNYPATLSEEERAFIELTVFLSGGENAELVKSYYTSKPEADPLISDSLSGKLSGIKITESGHLYYQFSYHLSDKDSLTVGARDSRIGDMANAVRKFWHETSLDTLLGMTERDMVSQLNSIAEDYSNDLITIVINENQVLFETISERRE